MIAEVISIGDELTSGQRLDTNSQWISERLGELGVRVMYHTTVADDLPANVEVFRAASQRADVIVTTGGLGPTADDLTRETLAQLLGVELVLDEGALAHIKSLFASRNRPMPERNIVQAMFPLGARPISNPEGTAPGVIVDVPRTGTTASRIYALPGVPAELMQMWTDTVMNDIVRLGGSANVIRHRRLKCFGVGESDLEGMLPDLIRRGRSPQVGITVSGATITLRITAMGATAEACQEQIAPTEKIIHDCLGDLVFGAEDDELEHAVARLLNSQRCSLATAEWGTAGQIAGWLGDEPTTGEFYRGGVVVQTELAAEQTLSVSRQTLANDGAIGAATAEAMASGAKRLFNADYALSVGQFPQVESGAGKPPSVYMALATPNGVLTRQVAFTGHSAIRKLKTSKQALDLLRRTLLQEQRPSKED